MTIEDITTFIEQLKKFGFSKVLKFINLEPSSKSVQHQQKSNS